MGKFHDFGMVKQSPNYNGTKENLWNLWMKEKQKDQQKFHSKHFTFSTKGVHAILNPYDVP